MTTTFDISYECGFDGDLGSLLSIDAHGHLDFADAEVFLADVVARELADAGFDESPTFGLEIEHLWRSTHPLVTDDDYEYEDRWTYDYTAREREGAVPVTRFQIASPWSRPAIGPNAPRETRDRRTNEFTTDGIDYWPVMCVKHPDEPASTGIPESRFADLDPALSLDGQVHYCNPCANAFHERLRIATEKMWAPERAGAFLAASEDRVIALAFGFPLRRLDLARVLHRTDVDGAGRRGLAAFAGAWRAAGGERTVAVAQPGWKVLTITDVEHLVEDYDSRA